MPRPAGRSPTMNARAEGKGRGARARRSAGSAPRARVGRPDAGGRVRLGSARGSGAAPRPFEARGVTSGRGRGPRERVVVGVRRQRRRRTAHARSRSTGAEARPRPRPAKSARRTPRPDRAGPRRAGERTPVPSPSVRNRRRHGRAVRHEGPNRAEEPRRFASSGARRTISPDPPRAAADRGPERAVPGAHLDTVRSPSPASEARAEPTAEAGEPPTGPGSYRRRGSSPERSA